MADYTEKNGVLYKKTVKFTLSIFPYTMDTQLIV